MAQEQLVDVPENSVGTKQDQQPNTTMQPGEEQPPAGGTPPRRKEGKRRRNRAAGSGRNSAPEDGDDALAIPESAIKVSATSNVKAVAGKVAHSSRVGDPPIVLAIGHTCLNVAVKAVAIARTYVKDKTFLKDDGAAAEGFDLVCQPAFRRTEFGRQSWQKGACLALYLFKRPGNADVETQEDISDLTVGSSSDPSTVAGALAARVREHKEVCLTAIGVDAVAIAIRAVCHARMYLENDNLDILARPQFVQVSKDTTTLSAMRLYIAVEPKV